MYQASSRRQKTILPPLESAPGSSSATDLEAQPDGPALSRRTAYVNDAVAGRHRSLEGEAAGTAA